MRRETYGIVQFLHPKYPKCSTQKLETDKNYGKKNKNKKVEMKSLEMQECQFENSVQAQRNGLKVGWDT